MGISRGNLIVLVSSNLKKPKPKNENLLGNLIVWSDGQVVHQGITSGGGGELTKTIKF